MPTYVFFCEACDHEFEVRTSWSKKSETTCPKCDGKELKELFGRYRIGTTGGGASSPSNPTGGFT